MVFSSIHVSPLDVFGAETDASLEAENASAPEPDEDISEVPDATEGEEDDREDWLDFISEEENIVTPSDPRSGNLRGFRPAQWDRDGDSVFEEDAEDVITPMNAGAPPAPVFSEPGGVKTGSSLNLNITPAPGWSDSVIRVTFDGSVPRVCDAYRAEIAEHGWPVGHRTSENGPYMAYHIFNPTPTGASTFSDRLFNWQTHGSWPGQCGCSLILPPGVSIPISSVGGDTDTTRPGDHISPMSNYGVGRGNPGPWNVPWSQTQFLEDSAYMSPHNTEARPWTQVFRPDWIKGAQGYYRAVPVFTGMAVRARAFTNAGIGGNTETQTYIVSSGAAGSFTNWQNVRIVSIVMPPEHFAHPITGIYRNWDRGFVSRDYGPTGGGQSGHQGAEVGAAAGAHWVVRGAPTETQTGGWGHMHPNVSQTPPAWGVPTWPWFWQAPRRTHYPYAWQGQIRAGLWDGRDGLGAIVESMWRNADNSVMSTAERNAAIQKEVATGIPQGGYGNPVRRERSYRSAQGPGRAVISGIDGISGTSTSSQEVRQRANVEMFDWQGNQSVVVFNQLANAWSFGNWSRAFPLRSIRLNFNQGGQPCSCCGELSGRSGDIRGLNIVPDTMGHYGAPGRRVDRFRHLNIRLADVEGTDARDPLSMWVAHPLRPVIQHATWGAIFINGEFWGMQNIQTHRHASLISQMYQMDDVPLSSIQVEGDTFFEEVANFYIIYPPRNVNADPRTERPAIGTSSSPGPNVRSIDISTGTRRTALGNVTADVATGNDIEGHTGYARRVPATFPFNHPRAGDPVPANWVGRSHLTREWYDYLNTVMCIDDFIDWLIVYMHLENWDSLSNNFEMWRTGRSRGSTDIHGDDEWFGRPSVTPGVHGADGRWRFIIQDFDNAIFHGTANFMNYFTAMASPTCFTGSCSSCGNANSDVQRQNTACMGEPLGSAAPMNFIVDNGGWRRPESATRAIRVLLQNPYFRANFVARYSTYTGTAFHPARMENLVREIDNTRNPFIGRFLARWGLMEPGRGPAGAWPNGTWGPQMVPWINNAAFTPAQRAQNWRGTFSGETSRWTPHTIGGAPENNWDEIGWNEGSGNGTSHPTRNRFNMTTGLSNGSTSDPNNTFPQLRSQVATLVLRAAPAGATYTYSNPASGMGGSFSAHATPSSASGANGASFNQNAIEHMRVYLSRGPGTAGTNPRPGNAYAAYGREHMNMQGLGTAGQSTTINWIVQGPSGTATQALAGQVGWLNVAGAYIRPDLYTFAQTVSGQSFLGRQVAGFPAFNIGNFSARYLRNMPIQVTANAQPGYTFSHFTVGTGATAHAGTALIETSGNRQNITGTALTGNINQETIWVTPASSASSVTVTAHFAVAERAPIINQIYGLGSVQSDGVTPVSHGFIELFNPHSTAVSLGGRSIQIQNIDNGAPANPPVAGAPNNTIARQWEVFDLPNVNLDPGRSFLILSQGSNTWHNNNTDPALGHVPRLILEGDHTINWPLSNRNLSVALVQGAGVSSRLSPIITAAEQNRVLDLVGARNEPPPRDVVHNILGSQPARRISRSASVRRISDRAIAASPTAPTNPQNTRNNSTDFEEIRLGEWNMGLVDFYRPRRRTENWFTPFTGTARQVNLVNAGVGSNVFPSPAHPNRIVGFQTGAPPNDGDIFVEWTAPGVTIVNPTSRTDAYFVMPASGSGAINVTAVWESKAMPEPSIIINQVHGQGGAGANAISHGFIELFNPTNVSQPLAGLSIQVMNDNDGIWRVRNLPSGHTMAPGESFLIVSTDVTNTGTPRYTIPNEEWDMGWNQRFSNNSMSVAIVEGPFPLSPVIALNEWPIVLDLVGARNGVNDEIRNFLGAGPAMRMWRQGSVRRVNNAQNTRRNNEDFESVDYRFPTTPQGNADLELVRPRWSGDGRQQGSVTILNVGPIGSFATPSINIPANTQVLIDAGSFPDNRAFSGWTVLQGGAHLDNASSRNTRFQMPAGAPAVVIAANWGAAMELQGTGQFGPIEFEAIPWTPTPIWTLQGYTTAITQTGESSPPSSGAFRISGTGVTASVANNAIAISNRGTTSSNGVFMWLDRIGITNLATGSYSILIEGTVAGAAGNNVSFRADRRNAGGSISGTNMDSPTIGADNRFSLTMTTTSAWVGTTHLRLATNGAGAGMNINITRIEVMDLSAGPMSVEGLSVDTESVIGSEFTEELTEPAARSEFLDEFVVFNDSVEPLNTGTVTFTQGSGQNIIHVPIQNPYEALTTFTLPNVSLNGTLVAPPYSVTWSTASGSLHNSPSLSVGGSTIRSSALPGGNVTLTAQVFGPGDIVQPTPHSIMVTGGTARSNVGTSSINSATEGTFVRLVPNEPTGPRQIFRGWTVNNGSTAVEIRYPTSASMANFTMPNGPVQVTANFVTLNNGPASALIIRQVYGNGGPGSNIISHGFIELFNPTSSSIPLAGLSLQRANGQGLQPWAKLDLIGSVPANSSFLVVSNIGVNTTPVNGVPRLVIPSTGPGSPDMTWDGVQFSNQNMAVALVSNTTLLPQLITSEADWGRVIDLVGCHSSGQSMLTANYLGEGSAGNISRSRTVRRIDGVQNTLDNREDFRSIDYRTPANSDDGITDAELALVRPRSSTSPPERPINVTSNLPADLEARFASASPPIAPQGTAGTPNVTINAGVAPPGWRFQDWTVMSPATGVTLTSSTSATTTFVMPASEVTVRANFVEDAQSAMPAEGVMIHQVYGQGSDNRTPGPSTNIFSHGFIELFNPTNAEVNLNGWSLQVQNGPGISTWQRLPLTGTIPARGSYLVLSSGSNAWSNTTVVNGVPRVVFSTTTTGNTPGRPDQLWNLEFSNNNMVVALVRNNTTLPNAITNWANIQDLVGIMQRDGNPDTVGHFLGNNPAEGISRQAVVRRRVDFRDDRRNSNNFNRIDYRTPANSSEGTNADELAQYRPRSSTNGSWGTLRAITVNPSNASTNATENMAYATQIVRLNSGSPPAGQMFSHWTASAGITTADIRNANSSAYATFIMPATPVTVTASYVSDPMPAPGLVINQIYGQGGPGENAINHSFIELYNPTSEPIPLVGLSVQVQMNPHDGRENAAASTPTDWVVFNIPSGTQSLAANHSFLIVVPGSTTLSTAHTLPAADATWNLTGGLSNRNISVAIVSNTAPLSSTISTSDRARLIDLVGAANGVAGAISPDHNGRRDWVHNFLVRARYDDGISRSRSVRRTIATENNRNNRADFESINFSGFEVGSPGWEQYRPRNRNDGAWLPPVDGIELTLPPSVIIHQIYGRGDNDSANAVNRCFIELYNPTNAPVVLTNHSLQIQMNPHDGRNEGNPTGAADPTEAPWRKFDFPAGTSIPARTSLLIASAGAASTNARFQIPTPDHVFAGVQFFSNRNMSVALVTNTTLLSPKVTEAEIDAILDLVGASNDSSPGTNPTNPNHIGRRDWVHNLLGQSARRVSRSEATRREWTVDNNGAPVAPLNGRHNRNDFEAVRYAESDDGIHEVEWQVLRPRNRTEGQWPAATYAVNIIDGGSAHRAIPSPASAGNTVVLNAGARPGQIFTGWIADGIDITGADQRVGATFTMPANVVNVTATWELNTSDVLLEIRSESDVAEATGNQFNATGGIPVNLTSASLTAWSHGVQQAIGVTGSPIDPRAPIVFNNFGVSGNATATGWRSVNHLTAPDANAANIGDATAFQIRFATTGYENIRFSASQRSTGGGPDRFGLAYRVGPTGPWVDIDNTLTTNRQSSGDFNVDNYATYNRPDAVTFNNLLLPSAVNDQEEVYLRVYMLRSSVTGNSGNTSINDILITGDLEGGTDTFDVTFNLNGGMYNSSTDPVVITVDEGDTIEPLSPNPTRDGHILLGWAVGTSTILLLESELIALLTEIATDITLTAQWEEEEELFLVTLAEGGEGAGMLVNGNHATNPVSVPVGANVAIFAGTNYPLEFDGWDVSPSTLELANASVANTTFTMIGQDVTVTAKWREVQPGEYEITVVDMSGEQLITNMLIGSSASAGWAEPGTAITLSAGTPPVGYEFSHWTGEVQPVTNFIPFNIDFGVESITPSALGLVSPFSTWTINNHQSANGASFEMPEGPIEIVANWTPVQVRTVRFELDGGMYNNSTADVVRQVNHGSSALPLTQNPTKDGYFFVGWSPALNLTNVTEDRTFTAQWSNRRIGDVMGNNNGRITSSSATAIARWLLIGDPGADGNTVNAARQVMVDNGFCLYAADINGDGMITVYDVTVLARWLVGLDVSKYINADGTRANNN